MTFNNRVKVVYKFILYINLELQLNHATNP